MDSVCIVAASGQNVFFEELLAALEASLQRLGVTTERAVDHFPRIEDGRAYLFVPHEYVPLTRQEAHPTQAQLRRSVALCTEQPGTTWFDLAATVAEGAGGVIDINDEGTAALARRGVPAQTLRLGYVPEWDAWGGDESRARSYDVTFMGGYAKRRAQTLAACASALAGRRSALHLFETAVPHTSTSEAYFHGQRKWRHLAASRMILNVHRSPLAYLEWQRVIGAMVNGCVVVSEHSLGTAPLIPGEHFVSVSLESMPLALRALLDDEDRLKAMRHAAYRLLREELPLDASIGVLADALEHAAAASVADLPEGALQPRPRPLPAPAPTSEPERLARERTEIDVIRMALKELFLGQRALRRQLAAPARPAVDTSERYGPVRPAPPRISVVLTVYDYADTVGEAIASVAVSDRRDYELIVVEDASGDASLDAIRTALEQHPWVPATLIARGRNGGLAAARNLGVARARGEYVFILDADNAVYPHCLSRLADTLDADSEAAFAYGLLEVFDSHGARDLMSWLSWEPQRLRYGNFIDAMAMIRRSALLAVGGYTTDQRLYGWEDFALWCAIGDRGWRGVLVPEIVARYRTGLQSMITLTDIDASAAWAALVERYGVLTAV